MSFLIATACITVNVLVKFNPLLAFFLLGCAYFPIGWWYHSFWVARRHYRKHPEVYIENTVTINGTSVSVENVNVGVRLNWNQLSFLLDTPKGLMFLLPNVQVLCWLPQRLFEGNEHRNAIVALAVGNSVQVRSMK